MRVGRSADSDEDRRAPCRARASARFIAGRCPQGSAVSDTRLRAVAHPASPTRRQRQPRPETGPASGVRHGRTADAYRELEAVGWSRRQAVRARNMRREALTAPVRTIRTRGAKSRSAVPADCPSRSDACSGPPRDRRRARLVEVVRTEQDRPALFARRRDEIAYIAGAVRDQGRLSARRA